MGTLRFAHPTAGLPRRFAPRNDVEKYERLIQAVIPGRALARTRNPELFICGCTSLDSGSGPLDHSGRTADMSPHSRDTMRPSCA